MLKKTGKISCKNAQPSQKLQSSQPKNVANNNQQSKMKIGYMDVWYLLSKSFELFTFFNFSLEIVITWINNQANSANLDQV